MYWPGQAEIGTAGPGAGDCVQSVSGAGAERIVTGDWRLETGEDVSRSLPSLV